MNFPSFNLDLKDTNDLVFFYSSEREFHIFGPIKENVSIPVFTLLTFGTGMTTPCQKVMNFGRSAVGQLPYRNI